MPEISTALIIKIIVIAVAIGGGIAVIYSVKKAVSNAIGRQLSRANDLLRTINDATEERQNNAMQFTYVDPNVVNNIKRDFPDLSTVTPKHYDDIHIHKSQVASYHRDHDAATAKFQVSLEYKLNGIKAQHIYEADYSYYLSMGIEGENASLICQFCGAPVDTAGSVCPYCGSEIHSSVERTWKVSRISMLR